MIDILRIPLRYKKSLDRMSDIDTSYIFKTLLSLCEGEVPELRDDHIGDLVSIIFSECERMDSRIVKKKGKAPKVAPKVQKNSTLGSDNKIIQDKIIQDNIIKTDTTTGIAQTIKSENEMFFDKIQNDMDGLILEMNMQEHYEDAKLELFKFWNYWTEKDMRGREKWKGEKTFEVKRRLTTWLLNKKFTFNQPKHGKRFSD